MEPTAPAPVLAPALPPVGPGVEYLTPGEIAAAYSVNLKTVDRWLSIGISSWDAQGRKFRCRLRGTKIGGRWKVRPDDLAEFIRLTNQHAPPATVPTQAEHKARVKAALDKLAAQGLL